jgi:hypothetical protein
MRNAALPFKMDFDRSKHNVIKYLPTNNDENIWGMSISGIGFQSIDPKGSYPLKGHPIGYTFNPVSGADSHAPLP